MAENRDREGIREEATVEELEQRFRETFFYTDRIDETVYQELERLRAALEERKKVEFSQTAEEFWERFEQDRGEELDSLLAGAARTGKTGKKRRYRAVLRGVLIAAAAAVLLAGAALAADSLGLAVWMPRWNAVSGQYEPAVAEDAPERPIPAALAELGIAEPVYPACLPEGFVLTESHISENPLVLMEQYARGDQRLSITVTPIEGFKTAVYQKSGAPVEKAYSGSAVHYIFAREGAITCIRYTGRYVTVVSGSITLEELKTTAESLGEAVS